MEALLLQAILAPLASDVDVVGGYGTSLLAQELARGDAGGFGALLASRLETHAD